jgi:hypothetical protein
MNTPTHSFPGVLEVVDLRDGNGNAPHQSEDGTQDVKGNQPLGLKQHNKQAL